MFLRTANAPHSRSIASEIKANEEKEYHAIPNTTQNDNEIKKMGIK